MAYLDLPEKWRNKYDRMHEALIGKKIHEWTILAITDSRGNNGGVYAFARCSCGTRKELPLRNIVKKTKPIKSCGCLPRAVTQKLDLLGQKIGLLTVVKKMEKQADGKRWWVCNCDCGGKIIKTTSQLVKNYVKSKYKDTPKNCGCIWGGKLRKKMVAEKVNKPTPTPTPKPQPRKSGFFFPPYKGS